MIGHFINALSAEQEDRLLGRRLARGGTGPGYYVHVDETACLIGATFGLTFLNQRSLPRGYNPPSTHGTVVMWQRFDDLVDRFGVERTANAIRSRILSNRARRILQSVSVPSYVETT